MGMFDGYKQAELQQACKERDLPASGSNAEMIDRLEQYELLNQDDKGEIEIKVEPAVDLDTPTAPPVVIPPAPPQSDPNPPVPPVDTADGGPVEAPRTLEVAFPCPAELSTGLHLEFARRAAEQARAQGHTPKGGDGGAHRTGWRVIDGVRHAVYEVHLRRR